MSEYPQKDFYRLNEVCQYTDTQPYVLRFWESEFPQLGPGGAADGRRLYRKSDIDLVRRIKHLLYEEECTLAEARSKLEKESGGRRLSRKGTAPARRASASPVAARAPEPAKREVAARRIASALPPREIPPPAPQPQTDVVPRDRYESAIEEIDHLRLQLKESELERHKAERALAETTTVLERKREQAGQAIARLERLLDRLG